LLERCLIAGILAAANGIPLKSIKYMHTFGFLLLLLNGSLFWHITEQQLVDFAAVSPLPFTTIK
jgi:hypothetical protein